MMDSLDVHSLFAARLGSSERANRGGAEHRQYEEGVQGQYLSAVAMLDQHKRQGHFGSNVRTHVHVSPGERQHQSRLKP